MITAEPDNKSEHNKALGIVKLIRITDDDDEAVRMLRAYGSGMAIEFADHIVRYDGQVAVLYGRNEKLPNDDNAVDVEDLFNEWYTQYKDK